MRIPEHEIDRLREQLKDAIIWKYPLKGRTVNSYRIPKGSYFVRVSTYFGRPTLDFAIPDPFADCETRYFASPVDGQSLTDDKRAKYIAYATFGGVSRALYEVQFSHPIVYKN